MKTANPRAIHQSECRRRSCCLLLAATIAVGAEASAQSTPPSWGFEGPWIGYDAGSSAFPGNPAPFERDPTAVTVADFNGDGWQDVALANYEYSAPGGGTNGQSGFALLLNQGDGSLGPPIHRTVSNKGCWDILAADFDADGDQDIAVSIANAFFNGTSARVYWNDGQAGFPTFTTLTVVDGPIGLAAADLNGDTNLDLAVVNYREFEQTGIVSLFFGNGSGSFSPQFLHTVGRRPFKIEAGDLDGDGSNDLAVAHEGQLVTILLNVGDGSSFVSQTYEKLFPMQGGMMYGCLTLADTDRDGDLDVFYGNTRSHQLNSAGSIVHLRNDGGVFQRMTDIPLTSYSAGPCDLTSGDVNGDQWPDLVAVHHSGRAGDGPRVVANNGAGGFLPAEAFAAGQGTFAAALTDLDRDGRMDLLTADRYSMMVTVHRNGPTGYEKLTSQWPTLGLNIRMDIGDVDGDGDLDVFTSTESTGGPGALLRNRGDGSFEAPVSYTHSTTYGRGVGRGKLRDLDNDGDLDLLYNDPHTDFYNGYDFLVALNDGTGVFGPIVEWPNGTGGNGDIDAFDLDNDGDLDVVNLEELGFPGGGAKRLFINRNRGDATFDPPYTIEISLGPHTLIGGDFNKDGNIDLVTAHWMPYGLRDFINVHLGNGDGFFQEEVVIKVGQGPRWLVTTDFNADGILDLATGNTGADGEGRETMTVLFGTGTGNFVGRTDYYVPFSPDLIGTTGLAAADHDRDGDIDILMTTVAGGVVVYLNDGSGGFSSQPRIGLSWDPWSITVADVTRDGVPDLVSITSDGTSGLSKALSVLPGKASAPTGVEVIYCTAKVNSCGTLPAIGFAGAPSATAGSGFDVRAKNAGAAKCGLVIYGDSGRANPPLPFLGGLICISTPIRRSVAVCDSSGTPPGCDGTLSIDMNAFATGALGGNPLPSLTMPGTQVNCQFWGRDTVANGALLTAALEYFVGP